MGSQQKGPCKTEIICSNINPCNFKTLAACGIWKKHKKFILSVETSQATNKKSDQFN